MEDDEQSNEDNSSPDNKNDDNDENVFDGDDPVSRLLRQLKSSGALIKKTRPPRNLCRSCRLDFHSRRELHRHLLANHVTLPSVVLQRVDDDYDEEEWDEDDWSTNPDRSDEEDTSLAMKHSTDSTKPFALNSGITIRSNKGSGLDSLLSLKNMTNISIKKINAPTDHAGRSPPSDPEDNRESSGTLRMTIKHASDSKTFRVVNGSDETPSARPEDENIDRPDIEDSKDGVLENLLSAIVKTESSDPKDGESVREDGRDEKSSTEDVDVKSKSSSRPRTPNAIAKPGKDDAAVPSETDDSESKIREVAVEKPLIVPKAENETSNVIEINCDSDRDDDEIVFVESSPAPVLERKSTEDTESALPSDRRNPPSRSDRNVTTEKQHNFNWNAPAKNSLESLLTDKSTDALLESLLSGHRKETEGDSGTSEYISLDRLGPQHTCEVCNTRFTSVRLLENHRKYTGHSDQMFPSDDYANKSMALSPYQSGFLMNSILPMKQLADTVSKITSNNPSASGAFTHQQNIMVNIQSFPGGPSHGHATDYNYPGIPHMPNTFPHPPPPSFNSGMNPGYPSQYPSSSYPNPYHSYHPQPPPFGAPQHYPQNQFPNPPSIPISNPYIQQQQQPSYQSSPMHPIHRNLPSSSTSSSSIVGQNVMPLQHNAEINSSQNVATETNKILANGIKIQGLPANGSPKSGPRMAAPKLEMRSQAMRGMRGVPRGMMRPGIRPAMRPTKLIPTQSIRGLRPPVGGLSKRPASTTLGPPSLHKKRMDVLIPNRHDNEECQVVSMQQQRDGLPQIHSVQGSRASLPGVQLNSQITWTKTKIKSSTPPPTIKDTNAMANLLASRGIKITQKQKPQINIPNLGSDISVTPTKISNFNSPENTNELQCTACNKMFLSNTSLTAHMSQVHPASKLYRCDHCPISYPTFHQLSEHKRAFHIALNAEYGLPVLDLSNNSTVRKLNNLGITNFIPLANREQGVGCFGVPIVSTQNALNGSLSNVVGALGTDGILCFGPVKPLPKC